MLIMYEPTITAVEGKEHRRYRKIAAPSFNETTHRTAWEESLQQARLMMELVENEGWSVSDVNTMANRLALHVLSKTLFEKVMAWRDSLEKAGNHEMTYSEAINAVLRHNSTLFMVPHPLLSKLSFCSRSPAI